MNIERRKLLRYFLGAGLFGAVACYPVFIERYIILINEYRIHFPNLPKEFSGLRIVHLTDLHYGALMPLRIIENVVQRVNKLKKDIVVCTGDYVHERNSIVQIDQVWPVLSKLQAKFGVLFVMGNHDHWADTDRSLYWSERSGQNLRGKVKAIEKNGKRLWIAGGGDLWEDHIGFDEILSKVPDNEFRIMLAHNPDSSDTQFDGHIDLLLAGHTHGGQVRIPFLGAPVLPVKNKNYSSGIKISPKGHKLFISRGIGWTIYPIRFNCFPEIAVLQLI
jgi:predicted MPP superfamily phosphohydrolase